MRCLRFLFVTLFVVAACGGSGPSGPPPDDGEARVGPEGGTVTLAEEASVGIPAGALGSEVTIRISPATAPASLVDEGAFGPTYRFEPNGQQFAVPVEVSIFVPAAALGGRDLAEVGLVSTLSTGGVEWLAAPRRDDAQGGVWIRGTTTHFSIISPAVPPNVPPTIALGEDRSVAVGATVDLTATAEDADGDPVTIAWSFEARPAGSSAAFSGATGTSTSFVPDVAGEYRVRVTVTDDRGESASGVVVVTASALVADAGDDRSATVGSTVTLDGTGSVGDDLTYAWSFVSTPGSAPTIQDADQPTARFVPNASGEYLVELVVSNDAGSHRDTVRVSVVQANRAPTVQLPEAAPVLVGDRLTLQAQASDPDDDDLEYTWSVVARPPGSNAAVTSSGAQAEIVPDVPGSYTVRVRVSDGAATAEAEVEVFGNPVVAGIYDGTFTIVSADGCGDGVPEGATATGDLPVEQPTPSRVVLDLPSLDPTFVSRADGVLEGTFFLFNGNVVIQAEDGSQASASGTIRGTMDGAMVDLDFSATLFSCTITGTIEGPKQ